MNYNKNTCHYENNRQMKNKDFINISPSMNNTIIPINQYGDDDWTDPDVEYPRPASVHDMIPDSQVRHKSYTTNTNPDKKPKQVEIEILIPPDFEPK